jgi:hypothetical protein
MRQGKVRKTRRSRAVCTGRTSMESVIGTPRRYIAEPADPEERRSRHRAFSGHVRIDYVDLQSRLRQQRRRVRYIHGHSRCTAPAQSTGCAAIDGSRRDNDRAGEFYRSWPQREPDPRRSARLAVLPPSIRVTPPLSGACQAHAESVRTRYGRVGSEVQSQYQDKAALPESVP